MYTTHIKCPNLIRIHLKFTTYVYTKNIETKLVSNAENVLTLYFESHQLTTDSSIKYKRFMNLDFGLFLRHTLYMT